MGSEPDGDLEATGFDFRHGSMLSKKSFGGNKRNFQKLLMRFVRSDVRDHIASQKNDHGPSYRHSRASRRRSSPKITICEIFGIVRFPTFSTASVKVRRTQYEYMSSDLRSNSDIAQRRRHFAFVPTRNSCTAANGISIRSSRRRGQPMPLAF
jgi:hypothetical protein